MAAFSFELATFVLIFCYALVRSAHDLEFSDLEAVGLACTHHKCSERTTLGDNGCKCDSACSTYRDCCVGVQGQSDAETAAPTDLICLNYGRYATSDIYAVTTCGRNWKGPIQVKESCESSTDFTDPVSAAPVISTSERVTYKNRYCAECNDADMKSLVAFESEISCKGIADLSEVLKRNEFSYNEEKNKWGIYRMDADGNSNFIACQVVFNLPDHLRRSVRFCRSNIISKCPRDWTRPQVKKLCEEYMAVVYDKVRAYKNPHCAICNNKTVVELSCKPRKTRKRRTSSAGMTNSEDPMKPNTRRYFSLRPLVVAPFDNMNGTTPQCPSDEIYDIFLNKCRKRQCVLPGYVVQNGRCVPDN